MIAAGVRVLFLLALLGLAANAQGTRTNENLIRGEIIFNDDTSLTCDFTYNPLVNEGLLFVKQDDLMVAYSVTKVKSFSFYDEEMNGRRYFYSLPIHNINGGATLGRYFFESIYENRTISVLGRVAVKKFNFRKGKITNYNKKYLLDHRNGNLYELSRKKMLELIGDKDEVMNYMYMKHYKLHEKDIDQYFVLIDLYSKL